MRPYRNTKFGTMNESMHIFSDCCEKGILGSMTKLPTQFSYLNNDETSRKEHTLKLFK